MSTLTPSEKRIFEDLFGMESGYVLSFSHSRFQEFILDVANLDILSEKYEQFGTSKAKRLRAFWRIEDNKTVAKVLAELLRVCQREAKKLSQDEKIKVLTKIKEGYGIISRLDVTSASSNSHSTSPSSEFINREFKEINFDNFDFDDEFRKIIKHRFEEAQKCFNSKAYLASIILSGSILEAILLDTASKKLKEFNQAKAAPKDKNLKVRPLQEWPLSTFIDVANELNIFEKDIQKLSHELRYFRNYIHPKEQLKSKFFPNENTAKICLQVLKGALLNIMKAL